jgi:luciferase family oxidoreductase group 1
VVTRLSILDLSPIVQGSTAAQALRNSLALAQHAERWGYHRYWVAEHHSLPGVASAATSVVLAYVGSGTSTIRIGAGGIMLPNHAPLVIAEQFGTLEALFPGRVDLGVGRAPGSDQTTARALRRTLATDPDLFPQEVMELMHYLAPAQEGQKVRAVPGEGSRIPIYILGSSLFGAQLAAALGLPFAFASHFAPAQMMDAIAIYRKTFRPSEQLAKPHVMLGANVFAANSEDEARYLMSSTQQAILNLRFGTPIQLPPPSRGFYESLSSVEQSALRQWLDCSFVGDRDAVAQQIRAFIERTGADELILACQMHDHDARLRSYELAAEVMNVSTAVAGQGI